MWREGRRRCCVYRRGDLPPAAEGKELSGKPAPVRSQVLRSSAESREREQQPPLGVKEFGWSQRGLSERWKSAERLPGAQARQRWARDTGDAPSWGAPRQCRSGAEGRLGLAALEIPDGPAEGSAYGQPALGRVTAARRERGAVAGPA